MVDRESSFEKCRTYGTRCQDEQRCLGFREMNLGPNVVTGKLNDEKLLNRLKIMEDQIYTCIQGCCAKSNSLVEKFSQIKRQHNIKNVDW